MPECADGGAPEFFLFGQGEAALGSQLLFGGFSATAITDVTPSTAVIPLPAAGWLLLGGLGALGLMRRRRA